MNYVLRVFYIVKCLSIFAREIMSDEMEDEVVQRMECMEFHGIKYDVELIVNTDVMTIQVESGETCEQWIGKFDASCKSCASYSGHCYSQN